MAMLGIYATLLVMGVVASFCITRFFSNHFWNLYGLFALCLGICGGLLVVIDSAFLLYTVLLYVFFVILFILALIDMEFLALPNAGLLVFLLLSIVVSFYVPNVIVSMQIMQGFAIMGVLFALKVFLESLSKREIFGEADIIVLGGIGMVFGVQYCVFSIFLASCFALIVAFVLKVIRHIMLSKIPFVSFLFLSVCALFFGGFALLDSLISTMEVANV